MYIQKEARSFKFWILKEDKLYYLCSENKGPDQLCSDCSVDLFLHRQKANFLMTRFI